jgi:hypothetical protein
VVQETRFIISTTDVQFLDGENALVLYPGGLKSGFAIIILSSPSSSSLWGRLTLIAASGLRLLHHLQRPR